MNITLYWNTYDFMTKQSYQKNRRQRLSFRNNRTLYKRVCDATWKKMISLYDQYVSFPVYEKSYRWWDGRDWCAYGIAYDDTISFTEHMHQLMQSVPRIHLIQTEQENCEYSTFAWWNKNCYMIDSSAYCEDVYYCSRTMNSHNCAESYFLIDSRKCYEATHCLNCYKCVFCYACTDCSWCEMSVGLVWCKDCRWCSDLQWARYCINNTQYTKQEYLQLLPTYRTKIHHGNRHDLLPQSTNSTILRSEKSTWTYLVDCYACVNCRSWKQLETCSYVVDAINLKSCEYVDCCDNADRCSQIMWWEKLSNCHSIDICRFCENVLYSSLCMHCKDCFWCVWLKNKQRCIYNTQYTKEAYTALLPKIISQMEASWERWEFLSQSLSPFSYSETIAQDYFPINKDEQSVSDKKWGEIWWLQSFPVLPLPQDVDMNFSHDIHTCSVTWKKYRYTQWEIRLHQSLWIPFSPFHPKERARRRFAYESYTND